MLVPAGLTRSKLGSNVLGTIARMADGEAAPECVRDATISGHRTSPVTLSFAPLTATQARLLVMGSHAASNAAMPGTKAAAKSRESELTIAVIAGAALSSGCPHPRMPIQPMNHAMELHHPF